MQYRQVILNRCPESRRSRKTAGNPIWSLARVYQQPDYYHAEGVLEKDSFKPTTLYGKTQVKIVVFVFFTFINPLVLPVANKMFFTTEKHETRW